MSKTQWKEYTTAYKFYLIVSYLGYYFKIKCIYSVPADPHRRNNKINFEESFGELPMERSICQADSRLKKLNEQITRVVINGSYNYFYIVGCKKL